MAPAPAQRAQTNRDAYHNTAHDFNAWTRMPSLEEQVQLPDADTADFTVVRALLRRGRTYEQAVESFEPYREVRESSEGAGGHAAGRGGPGSRPSCS